MSDHHLRILFLGAGKRLSLLEAFLDAARAEGVELSLFCAELESLAPVGAVAQVLQAPRFDSDEFPRWMVEETRERKFDVVIPNMDSATVALSEVRELLAGHGAWPLVSEASLCRKMEDKHEAEQWFLSHGFVVPGRRKWPRILKKRRGFGGRGQVIVADEEERSKFINSIPNPDTYIEQEVVEGPEYSVDAYVDRTGRYVAAMPRIRIEVVDGEVNTSMSAAHAGIEAISRELFSLEGWQGPLTAQFIDTADGPVLIEVNPRFGGGVTHSIHCGLDMPRWVIRERLGHALPPDVAWNSGSLMMRCRRDVFFDN